MVPVKIIKAAEIPPARRRRDSPIKHTAEWLEVLALLSSLTPGQAIAVEFSPATLRLGASTPERFKRLLQDRLTEEGRQDLKLFFRGKDANGQPVLYIRRD